MKRRLTALVLFIMVAFAGCTQKNQFAEWEEEWAASEAASSQAVSEEDNTELIPSEMMDSENIVKYNAQEQGFIRPYELNQSEKDAPYVDWAYARL